MAEPPDRLAVALTGRYRIERLLGSGGMADVYLALDLRHPRHVAIKVLKPELAALLGRERFQREIELAATLQHPYILPLWDSGSEGDLLYYVMPYLEGDSLRHRLEREKQLPLGDVLRITGEVAEALDYAHGKGVVHRDIKPENILFEGGHAVVADFGIARALGLAGGTQLTETGVTLGTPAYMSTEQALGGHDLDGRSDQYSLACVAYEMLAGQPPFTGPTAESVVHQHVAAEPRPVTDLRATVPAAAGTALMRALAKTPADRFGTAVEFAASIAVGPGATGPRAETRQAGPGSAGRSTGRRVRATAFSVAAVLVVLVMIAAWQRWSPFSGWPGGSGTAHAGRKDWILVAEFDGPPDDSLLAVATRDLVSAALDQSEIATTVPREQIRLALETAGKPTNTRVDAELAKELAYRSAVRAVVEGRIGRVGKGYSVVLRVVDAESLKVILTERAVAMDQDALIPALGQLAEKLRAGLGERRSAIQATRPLEFVATPSLEAYRLFLAGSNLVFNRANRAAIPVLREAIALDPEFAYAWRRLGATFNNLGELDSALVAYDEALRHPQRLTAVQRLYTAGSRAMVGGDLRAALSAYDRALQNDPGAREILFARGNVLWALRRFEESLESFRESVRGSPFGVVQNVWNNELTVLNNLGRVDEARELVRNIAGRVPNASHRISIEIQANNWPLVERIADTLLALPGLDDDDRAETLHALASARAARGAFRSAGAVFERTQELARAGGFTWWHQPARARMMLTIASGGAIPLPPDAWAGDSSAAAFVTRGLRAAIAGDQAAAQRFLQAARAHPRPDWPRHGAAPALLEARIEMLEGRWAEAARILRPAAAQPVEFGFRVPYRVGMSFVRWSLADAFEQLGWPDSAALVLERVATDPGPAQWESHARGILLPFAHRRLVLLYARMGRIEDARRHWQVFSETVRAPDPEIQPLIAEARAALMSAEGMAKSARR